LTTPSKTALHLLSNRWNSAITEYALSTARALRLQGWHCVFAPLAGSPAEARSRATTKLETALDVQPMPRFSAGALFDLTKILQDTKPQLIVAYGGPENLLTRVARRIVPGVKIVRFRGHEVPEGQLFFKERHRVSHSHCDFILTPADFLTNLLRPVSSCPVETVPLGIDTDRFHYSNVETPRSRDVVILGRLDPVKGHRDFMGKFATLLRKGPDLGWRPRLHIIGEPANLSVVQLQNFAVDAGLSLETDVLITATRVENIAEVMAKAVAGIIPSLGSEIICRVAEEFLLCGTPIAVSGVGSLDEVLMEPGFGVSWKGQSELEVTRTLSDFIKSSFAETAEARRSRAARAKDLFSYESMGIRITEIMNPDLM